MNAAVESLANLPGVTGLCHHRGAEVLWGILPENVSEERALALCAAVHAAFGAYAGAGRVLREAWFEFPGFGVLVLAAPAVAPGDFLTFFITDRAAAAGVAAAVKAGRA